MLLALSLIATATAASAEPEPVRINLTPLVYLALQGPRRYCAEDFSVLLLPDESIAWTIYPGGIVDHILHSNGEELAIRRWIGRLPVNGAPRDIRLTLSPVSQGRAEEMPPLSVSEPGGRPRETRVFSVDYLLYGTDRNARPLTVSTYTENPDLEIPAAQRVAVGSMAERGCTVPTRLDPAVTSEIRTLAR